MLGVEIVCPASDASRGTRFVGRLVAECSLTDVSFALANLEVEFVFLEACMSVSFVFGSKFTEGCVTGEVFPVSIGAPVSFVTFVPGTVVNLVSALFSEIMVPEVPGSFTDEKIPLVCTLGCSLVVPLPLFLSFGDGASLVAPSGVELAVSDPSLPRVVFPNPNPPVLLPVFSRIFLMMSSMVLIWPSSTASMERLESVDVSLGSNRKDVVMFPTKPLSLDIERYGGEENVTLIICLVYVEGDKPRAENVAW